VIVLTIIQLKEGKTSNKITNSLAALKPVDKQLMRSIGSQLLFFTQKEIDHEIVGSMREQLTTTDNSLHSNVSVYTLNYSIGRHRVSGGSEREILNRSARHTNQGYGLGLSCYYESV